MDADGPLMEQPSTPVVDLALGCAWRRFRATHDSFYFKNQQSSLDNHQSIPPCLPQPNPWGRGGGLQIVFVAKDSWINEFKFRKKRYLLSPG